MTHILVVEDEPGIAFALEADLHTEGYTVTLAATGDEALRLARAGEFDLILLDIMLPGKDGFEVCRERRRAGSRTPIILLTAKAQKAEKVMGLELGADDYLTKPFSPRELVARVKAVLRRTDRPTDPSDVIRVGDLQLDVPRMRTEVAGRSIDLTPTEFTLLATLARQPGRIFTRSQLLDALHGVAFESYERAIDSHIKNLRRKLEPDPRQPRFVLTVYGVGYRLADDR